MVGGIATPTAWNTFYNYNGTAQWRLKFDGFHSCGYFRQTTI